MARREVSSDKTLPLGGLLGAGAAEAPGKKPGTACRARAVQGDYSIDKGGIRADGTGSEGCARASDGASPYCQ